jgi:hypothetical protein
VVAGEQRREAVDDGWQSVGDRREADLRREAHKLFFFRFFSFVREENRREIGERSEDPGWRSSGGQEKARRAGTTLASAKKKRHASEGFFFALISTSKKHRHQRTLNATCSDSNKHPADTPSTNERNRGSRKKDGSSCGGAAAARTLTCFLVMLVKSMFSTCRRRRQRFGFECPLSLSLFNRDTALE